MKQVRDIKTVDGRNECLVTLNDKECVTIYEAINWYIQRHEDKTDITVKACIELDKDIHQLRTVLRPS